MFALCCLLLWKRDICSLCDEALKANVNMTQLQTGDSGNFLEILDILFHICYFASVFTLRSVFAVLSVFVVSVNL